MKRSVGKVVYRIVLTGILAALGIVLMQIKIPTWLGITMDPSDCVILVSYVTCGFWSATAVALIKALIDFLVSGVGIYGIGQIAAFIASMTYIIGMYLFSHVFKLFNKGFLFRVIGYVLIALLVAAVMVAANYIFVTPTYMNGTQWDTCFNSEIVTKIETYMSSYGSNYFMIIFVMYFPFNLLKAGMVCAIYEAVFNYVIFYLFKHNEWFIRYFGKEKKEEKKPEVADSETSAETNTEINNDSKQSQL